MSVRRFEFAKGASSKFWAVERRARTVTVTFGRIGTTGQEKAKSFANEAKAVQEEERLIAEKLRKGYREVLGGAKAKPAKPDKPTASPKSTKRESSASRKRATKHASGRPARLPPSYKECLRRSAAIGEWVRRLDPEERRVPQLPGYPDRLEVYPVARLARARKLFLTSLIPPEDRGEPGPDLSRLQPFGDDTQRTWICWDPDMPTKNGELTICFVDLDAGDVRTDAAGDLLDILAAYRRDERED